LGERTEMLDYSQVRPELNLPYRMPLHRLFEPASHGLVVVTVIACARLGRLCRQVRV